MVNDEYRHGIKTDFSITETDDAYTVKLESSEYTVSNDLNECSCLCFFFLQILVCHVNISLPVEERNAFLSLAKN